MRRTKNNERRPKLSGNRNVSSEYSAPSVLRHMQDMLCEAGDLLARDAPVRSRINRIAMASGLTAGRIKRYLYDEVKTVPAHEYNRINDWLGTLRARLGDFEHRYNEARREVLAGNPALAAVCPPEIAAAPDRPVAPSDAGSRLVRAQIISEGRKQTMVRR